VGQASSLPVQTKDEWFAAKDGFNGRLEACPTYAAIGRRQQVERAAAIGAGDIRQIVLADDLSIG
jgi:hypothetical protein